MDSLPDHILLSVFSQSSVQDRLLSLQLVCDRWNHLCLYDLARGIGPALDTGMFEAMSIVGVRNRNNKEIRQCECDLFLYSLLNFVLTLSEEDCFQCIRFTVSGKTRYPEWVIDDTIIDLIHSRCPNIQKLDFDDALLETDALEKLTLFKNMKNLVIKRVGVDIGPVLENVPLETLTISGKEVPLTNSQFGHLRQLIIHSPFPSSYIDLLTTLTSSAPVIERVVRGAGPDPMQMPVDVVSQIRSHPTLKEFSDGSLYLCDDNVLPQLIETKKGQFEFLKVYSEDCVKLSPLCQLERLRTLVVDGRNLEPNELSSVFLIPNVERINLSWTFKDDRSCVIESQSQYAGKMMDIRCGKLKYLHMHLDYMSADGRAWGKNTIMNVLQQCPRLKRLTNSDWLLGSDYTELREVEGFTDVLANIDININSIMDLGNALYTVELRDDQLLADPVCWFGLTTLKVFINEDYYLCDLDCINGDTLPNLTTFKIQSDDDVYFERMCPVMTLDRLHRIEGVIRFQNPGNEADWLDQVGEHKRLVWISTVQTTLTPNMFCDVLMRARARMREEGHVPPATVVYVSTAGNRKLRTTMENDRKKWDAVTKILYTNRIMLHVRCN